MKVVVAPNAFKASLSAAEAAVAIAEGVHRACPGAEVVCVPVADGGDGLVEVTLAALGGELRTVAVTGPRFRTVPAGYCLVPDQRFAAIEMARASGVALLAADERDPAETTSLGTGELIRAALDAGAGRIAVGLGGSATTDGGIGAASALGVRFLDAEGRPVSPVGGSLSRIRRIDPARLDPRLSGVSLEAICDVDNPLCGPDGAAAVYGPQKGASPAQVAALDAGLAHLAALIAQDLGIEVRDRAGAGAAGGLGAGMLAFLRAVLRPGVEVVLELVGLDRALQGADLVLTGEGRLDAQTARGKAPAGVAAAARARGLPCLAIAGAVDACAGALTAMGFAAAFSLCPAPMSLERAMAEGGALLAAAAENAVRCFLAGRRSTPVCD